MRRKTSSGQRKMHIMRMELSSPSVLKTLAYSAGIIIAMGILSALSYGAGLLIGMAA